MPADDGWIQELASTLPGTSQDAKTNLARQIIKLAQSSSSVDEFCANASLFGSFDKSILESVYAKRDQAPIAGKPAIQARPQSTRNSDQSGLETAKSAEGAEILENDTIEVDRQWYDDDQSTLAALEGYEDAPQGINKRNRPVTDEHSQSAPIFFNPKAWPPFLGRSEDGPSSTEGDVSVFKDPTGRMALLAKAGSETVRARRALQERSKKAAEATSTNGTALGKLLGSSNAKSDGNRRHNGPTRALTRQEILEQRQSLPAFAVKDNLVSAIQQNQVIIVVGETGSGKTTQLPQFLLDAGLATHGIIGCTQPRRVAAMSVAQRVAVERGSALGGEVGYTIRFEDKTSPETKIKFMTDGILLRESLSQAYLDKYSCIIIDEAHERSLSTDIVLGLLKRILSHRLDLKVIITSATLNAARFSSFFGHASTYTIQGRTFPVNIHNLKSPVDDYVKASVQQVLSIHLSSGPGDILVFMTGQEDVEATVAEIEAKLRLLDNPPALLALPMYSQLPADMQARIFLPAPPGIRKVVVSTNIAETSLTIDGIVYVVDSGYTKLKVYKPKLGMDTLQLAPISLDVASQRAGRAGRVSEGHVYRMFTKSQEQDEMFSQIIPEIKRTSLANTLLLLKSLRVKNVEEFDLLDPPSSEGVRSSLYDLWVLGALNQDGDLTSDGVLLSKFPMDPSMAMMLLASIDEGCTAEMITILAMLSVPSVFVRSKERAKESDAARMKFTVEKSDHLTLMNVFQEWKAHGSKDEWAVQNFLHPTALRRASAVRTQLASLVKSVAGHKIESAGANLEVVRRSICRGYFHQSARARNLKLYIGIRTSVGMQLHPTSVLYASGDLPQYVVYHELILTSQQYMTVVTACDAQWFLDYGYRIYHSGGEVPESSTSSSGTPAESDNHATTVVKPRSALKPRSTKSRAKFSRGV